MKQWHAFDARTVTERGNTVYVPWVNGFTEFNAGTPVAIVIQQSGDNYNIMVGIIESSVQAGSNGKAMLTINLRVPLDPMTEKIAEKRGKQVTANTQRWGFLRSLDYVPPVRPSSLSIQIGQRQHDTASAAVNIGVIDPTHVDLDPPLQPLDADGNGCVSEAEMKRYAEQFNLRNVPMTFGDLIQTIPVNMPIKDVTYNEGFTDFDVESYLVSGVPVVVSKSNDGSKTYVDVVERLERAGLVYSGGADGNLVNAQNVQPQVQMQMLATRFEAIRTWINSGLTETNNVGVDVVGISPTTVCNGDSYIGYITDNNGNPFGPSALTKVNITSSIGVNFYYNGIDEFPLFTEKPVVGSTSVTSFTITIRGEYNGTNFNQTFPISITQCSQDVTLNHDVAVGDGTDVINGGKGNNGRKEVDSIMVEIEPVAQPTAARFPFLQVVDMDRGVEVLSNKMIEKVVRIKRSGKCGYRIVLSNVRGIIDSVRIGKYENCIMTMEDYDQQQPGVAANEGELVTESQCIDPTTRPVIAQEVKPVVIENEGVTAIQVPPTTNENENE
jgi:hypothetical protein